MKRIFTLMLILALGLLVFAACNRTEEEPQPAATPTPNQQDTQETNEAPQIDDGPDHGYPAYLNLDGHVPLVQPGTDITISMMIRRETIATSDVNTNWMATYIREVLGVNLDIEETTAIDHVERRNLAIAADMMPDIMINQAFNAQLLVQFGMIEGMLLPLNEFISPTLTPNMVELMERFPEIIAMNQTPDGNLYTFGNILERGPFPMGVGRVFINERWMELAGVTEIPRTLDDFLEMLRAFGTLTPEQTGAMDRVTPLISANEGDRGFILQSLGFLSSDNNWGVNAAIDINTREVVIPAAQPAFADFIRFYHTLYTEGLIHADYFTMSADRAVARAHFAEGNAGVMADAAPYLSLPEFDQFDEWVSVMPMTSSANPTRFVPLSNNVGLGTFVVSANTQHPELVMRLLDWMYSPEMGFMSSHGPVAGSDDTLGVVTGIRLIDGTTNWYHPDVASGLFESDFDFRVNAIALSQETPRITAGHNDTLLCALGIDNPEPRVFDMTDGDDHYIVRVSQAHNGYFIPVLPTPFLQPHHVSTVTDIHSIILAHVQSEFARFVVGQRPIEEIDDFFDELERMGILELQDIWREVHANYMAGRTTWTPFELVTGGTYTFTP
ncbi:MAG: extracellular solute-binding protein [Defluviitaleaceae bacterium]|nr:extracellular solute-binding protein [Defluviitaleaceae bacterium]